MQVGKVIGKVITTQKDPQLKGVSLRLVQPLDDELNPQGSPVVASDGIQARRGDLVFYVTGREGTLTLRNRKVPTDAGIVGLIDNFPKANKNE